MRRPGCVAAIVAAAALTVPAPAVAAPVPDPYRNQDFGGFRDVLPPGTNGLDNLQQLLQFRVDGTRPPHSDDQLGMYRDLMYGAPNLSAGDIGKYYKDSSFGVRPDDIARTYTPCPDVTVVRDKSFNVPHVYGSTRAGLMCGLGYVGAEDRLFFMDVLRHAGRADLSSFAGGAAGNRDMDRSVWADTPYTEADLQRQVDYNPPGYEAEARAIRNDGINYVNGVNRYIAEARLDVTKMPGEYPALLRITGPANWKTTDLIAEAALIGGIFGKGGGNELGSALVLQAARARYGRKKGDKVWRDFRRADDPEAPVTARTVKFPYGAKPRNRKVKGLALPDPGTLKMANVLVGSSALPTPGGTISGILGGLGSFPGGASNALLVSKRESRGKRPIAVMGPQVSYFNPQILMEQDAHGPGMDARGAAFAGVNLYVQLGRGRDYSWSATSSGQDMIDTFAVPLCNPNGSRPTIDASHYLFRGQCLPFEVLTHVNSWVPNAADMTPPGSETLRTLRTKLGIVTARATVNGRPVAYTKLRSTYFHEIESAIGFRDFNDPNKIKNVRDFQRAASGVGFAFNWFYADNKDIGYFNSGSNPVRHRRVDPSFPTDSAYEWRGFNPDNNSMTLTPFNRHPQVINQRYITSWNNKQARRFSAADDNWSYGSAYRVDALNERVKAGIRGKRKMTLAQLISAMEDAGSVDLRGARALPYALKIMKRKPIGDPQVAQAVRTLSSWAKTGAHRRDLDRSGHYDQGEAVKIMDTWWPFWMQAEFGGPLGKGLYDRVLGMTTLDDLPNTHGGHVGSAYNGGFYQYANKDLRQVLGKKVKGRFSRRYCGKPKTCRKRLLGSLKASLDAPTPYGENAGCGIGDDQACFDSIIFRPTGGITMPNIPWINRPTYQQAVQINGHR